MCKTNPISTASAVRASHYSTIPSFHHSILRLVVRTNPIRPPRQGWGVAGADRAKQSQKAVGGSQKAVGGCRNEADFGRSVKFEILSLKLDGPPKDVVEWRIWIAEPSRGWEKT